MLMFFFLIATEKNNASTKIVKINGDRALIMNPISSGMTKVCNVQLVVQSAALSDLNFLCFQVLVE